MENNQDEIHIYVESFWLAWFCGCGKGGGLHILIAFHLEALSARTASTHMVINLSSRVRV